MSETIGVKGRKIGVGGGEITAKGEGGDTREAVVRRDEASRTEG